MLAAIVIAILMLAVWLLSIKLRDVSVIDIAWGLGFVLIAWTVWFQSATSEASQPSPLLPILVSIWAARLSGYLYWRNHGKEEDYRYRQMRKTWGDAFWYVSLITVFLLQGVIMWIVSLPVQLGLVPNADQSTSGPFATANFLFAVVGVLLWFIGFLFESIGDWQLARFKANSDNRGRVLNSGLWRYTRHPNYFGDSLVWWGFYFVAISMNAPGWTIVSPVLMTILLLKISGVALLEKSLRQSKPAYCDYVSRTSSFFPWPPSKR